MGAADNADQRDSSDACLENLERAPEGRSGDQAVGYGSIQPGSKQMENFQAVIERDRLIPAGAKQVAALDMTRILCVFLVSVDHGGTRFGVWNTMYVQAWVLQYLFLVCGICFAMSTRSVWGYAQRLGLYFVIGVCCNWTAFVVKGLDWQHNMWNVVFQFWFIVGLVGFCTILAPLRHHLRTITERGEPLEERPLSMNLAIVFVGAVVVTMVSRYIFSPIVQYFAAAPLTAWATSMGDAAVFWDLPQTLAEADAFLWRFVSYFELTLINIYIAVVWPMISKSWGLCGWLMILNTYCHKVFLYRAQEARLLTGFDCTTIGLAVFFLGLSNRKAIGCYFVRYWFFLLFTCALLWPPGTYGRFDEHPPRELGPRMKDNLLELVFLILFLCGMERLVDPAIFTEDRMEWLGYWALVVFLVHKAIHITTPEPFNWLAIFALAPLCWWFCSANKPAPSQPSPA